MLLHQINEILERCPTAFSKIDHFVGMRTINGSNDSIYNVGNISVVTTRRTITKLLDFKSATDPINKFERSHIGTSSRSVYREETETRHIEFVEMMVGVGQELTGFLGGCVGRYRIVYIFFFGKVGGRRSTVHGRRRCKHKVLDSKSMTQFHEIRSTTNIGMNVDIGVLYRRTYSSTCCHVTYPLRPFSLKHFQHEGFITDISLVDRETLFIALDHIPEHFQIRFLDFEIVIIIHFVYNYDVIAAF
mmetsp:Transcript_5246/g.9996  ORF Transcript_5246/g.9996 Transcript_5246/m.9996 type:complete len:246 (-) Transcript_5246:634-1371(-)